MEKEVVLEVRTAVAIHTRGAGGIGLDAEENGQSRQV